MRTASASSNKVVDFKDLAKLSDKQWRICEALTERKVTRILAGGAGGGGKSYGARATAVFACLALALAGVKNPRWILARNSYNDLKDNHASQLVEEWGDWGELKQSDKESGFCFKFHNKRLGVILLRNLDKVRDKKGARVHGACIDELTETSELAYAKLEYQCTAPGPFNSVVGFSNPDGPYFGWVMEGWKADTQPDGWWTEEGEGFAFHKLYLPFLPTDNPIWEQMKDAFMASIANLPEPVRRGRLLGLWGAPEGARWPHISKQVHQFRMEDLPYGIPPHWKKGIGIDYGMLSPFAAYSIAIDPEVNRILVYRERYGAKVPTERQAMSIRDMLEVGEKLDWCMAEPAMWQKSPDPLDRVPVTPAQVYEGQFMGEPRLACGLSKGRQITSRTLVWTLWDELTRIREDGTSILQIDESCKELWKELTTAVYYNKKEAERRIGDIDPKNADHGLTAVWYGLPTWAVDKILNPKPKVSAEEREMKRLRKEMIERLRRAS